MTPEEFEKIQDTLRFEYPYYGMDGQEITLSEWGDLIERGGRVVKKSEINGYLVSTILVGIDMGFGGLFKRHEFGYNPVIFETMIFKLDSENVKNWDGEYQERYCTKEQALEGHQKACKLVLDKTKSTN